MTMTSDKQNFLRKTKHSRIYRSQFSDRTLYLSPKVPAINVATVKDPIAVTSRCILLHAVSAQSMRNARAVKCIMEIEE